MLNITTNGSLTHVPSRHHPLASSQNDPDPTGRASGVPLRVYRGHLSLLRVPLLTTIGMFEDLV